MKIEAQRLRSLIAEKKVKDFAAEIGEKVSTISNVLNEHNGLTPVLATKICDYFNVSMDWLYGRTEVKTLLTESIVQEDMAAYVPKDKYIAVLEKLNAYQEEELNKNKIRQTTLEK